MNLSNAYSAPGLLDMALGLLEGRLDYTPGLVDAVYQNVQAALT